MSEASGWCWAEKDLTDYPAMQGIVFTWAHTETEERDLRAKSSCQPRQMCHQREWGGCIPVAIGKEAVLPRGLPERGKAWRRHVRVGHGGAGIIGCVSGLLLVLVLRSDPTSPSYLVVT